MGTHLNGLNLSRQFKLVSTTDVFIRSRLKYTDCNLKTTKLLDCALIGACAVIRWTMVCPAVIQDKRNNQKNIFFLFSTKTYVTHNLCFFYGEIRKLSKHLSYPESVLEVLQFQNQCTSRTRSEAKNV